MWDNGCYLMSTKQYSVMVGTRVTPKTRDAIQVFVKNGDYLNESDFIRTAIREKLKKKEKT